METSSAAVEKDPVDPQVNVVLYNDHALRDERNDFLFDRMSDAILFCKVQYFVADANWIITKEWELVEH